MIMRDKGNQKYKKAVTFGELNLEVTSQCNLRCPFCPEGSMQRPQGVMPVNFATSLLDDVAKHQLTDRVYFHSMGEPLLHPQLEEILAYAAKRFKETLLYTNMTLLTEDRLEKIVKTGVSNLHLSVQCVDEASYAFKFMVKPKISFEEFLERVKYVIRSKIKHNLPKNRVQIQHIFNLEDVRPTKTHALEEKILESAFINREQIKTLYERYSGYVRRYLKLPQCKEGVFKAWNGRDFLSLNLAPGIDFHAYPIHTWGNKLNKKVSTKTFIGKCQAIERRETLSVSWDGRVIFCCLDYDFENSFGRVGEDGSLLDIIQGEKAQAFFRQMKWGIVQNERCRTCLGSTNLPKAVARSARSLLKPTNAILNAY